MRGFHASGTAGSKGITEVLHEDREVFRLKVKALNISSVEGKVAEIVEQPGIGYGDYSP